MAELVSLRGENSKTYDIGKGKRQLVIGGGIQHWKYDYSDKPEEWKECDLRWDGNRIDKAPYILVRDGNKLAFTDRKTKETSTIELTSVKSLGSKIEIIPFESGVKFQCILPTGKVPFEAQFKVTGKVPVSRAYDDEGELEMEVVYDEKTGILTERLSEVRDFESKKLRQVSGEIRIDPIITIEPSSKDTSIALGSKNESRGASILYCVGHSSYWRNFMEFDISAIPSGIISIDAATLSLYYASWNANNPSGRRVYVYKLTRTDWLEGTNQNPSTEGATWNHYKIIGATKYLWTTGGGDYVTSSPVGSFVTMPSAPALYLSWDILAIVQNAYSNSNPVELLIRHQYESGSAWYEIRFNSKETATNKPKLVINYTAPVVPHEASAFFLFM